MDRNQVIGLVLIAALLIGYAVIYKPPQEPIEPVSTEQTTPETPAETTSPETVVSETPVAQDTSAAAYEAEYGVFAGAVVGEDNELTVENKDLRLTFGSQGGRIKSVELKEFQTYDEQPLILLDDQSSQQLMRLQTVKGNLIISDLYFQTGARNLSVSEGDSTKVTYSLTIDANNSIEQIYTIPGEGYEIGYEIRVNGLRAAILGDQLNFIWTNSMKRLESNLKDSRAKSTVKYYGADGDFDQLKMTSMSPQQEQAPTAVKWASFNQKFFNAGIIADRSFSQGVFNSDVPELDSTVVKNAAMNLNIPLADLYAGGKFRYYFGPNDYKILKRVAPDYEENIEMGYVIVSWVNKYIIVELFAALEKVIPNYGLIIIIMVFIIKLVLFPLSRKSYLSMAKMKALKPELDAIKERLKKENKGKEPDMQKMQQEQMQLYRQVGVSPLSGCIPVVLQMPILFAMFFFFPNSIELRQQSFLWAHDLSTFDVLINLPFNLGFGSHISGFTLLMTMSTILYTWSNNQVSTVQGPMKTIGYIMPVIFFFVLNSYASGLSFYYFVSNLVTFGQQMMIRRFVDEDKIRKVLEENKKKNANKKKSKFQMRLDEAMKASQEAQKQKQQRNKR